MPAAIRTVNLTKVFSPPRFLWGVLSEGHTDSRIVAVDHVSLEIQPGEIFALLGANGAGKTTLVRILSTLVLPTSGTAYVHGHDVVTQAGLAKASIGLVHGEGQGFFVRLTCRANLRFYGALYGLRRALVEDRIRDLSDLLGVTEFLDRRYDLCSTGMKQRLAIARSLLHSPQILFLDEPTRSLDPAASRNLWSCIRSLARERRHTIVLVTHRLEEARELGDRAGIMQRGRVTVLDPRGSALDEAFAEGAGAAQYASPESRSLH